MFPTSSTVSSFVIIVHFQRDNLPPVINRNVCGPVGHGLLPLHNVACDWLSSIGRGLPADEGGVVVNVLYCGLFGSIWDLCVDNRPFSSDAAGRLPPVSLRLGQMCLSGLTEDVSGLGLR